MSTLKSEIFDTYEMTIGVECHVQLATKTKLFSPADNDARDADPNSKVHPIDFGLPGMLPVLNRHAVDLAIRAGKALNAEGIAVRTGHHCAQPILRRFGVETAVRPSLAFYNTLDEIDLLVREVRKLAAHRR